MAWKGRCGKADVKKTTNVNVAHVAMLTTSTGATGGSPWSGKVSSTTYMSGVTFPSMPVFFHEAATMMSRFSQHYTDNMSNSGYNLNAMFSPMSDKWRQQSNSRRRHKPSLHMSYVLITTKEGPVRDRARRRQPIQRNDDEWQRRQGCKGKSVWLDDEDDEAEDEDEKEEEEVVNAESSAPHEEEQE
jgi:hypothetical protein